MENVRMTDKRLELKILIDELVCMRSDREKISFQESLQLSINDIERSIKIACNNRKTKALICKKTDAEFIEYQLRQKDRNDIYYIAAEEAKQSPESIFLKLKKLDKNYTTIVVGVCNKDFPYSVFFNLIPSNRDFIFFADEQPSCKGYSYESRFEIAGFGESNETEEIWIDDTVTKAFNFRGLFKDISNELKNQPTSFN